MKYQVTLLGTPWNKNELTQGVLRLPGVSLVELNELNMNRPFSGVLYICFWPMDI